MSGTLVPCNVMINLKIYPGQAGKALGPSGIVVEMI